MLENGPVEFVQNDDVERELLALLAVRQAGIRAVEHHMISPIIVTADFMDEWQAPRSDVLSVDQDVLFDHEWLSLERYVHKVVIPDLIFCGVLLADRDVAMIPGDGSIHERDSVRMRRV